MSYERTVTIVPHGYFKDIWPEPFQMSGFSVEEILNGIQLQTKELIPLPGQPRHSITIPGFDSLEKLQAPLTKRTSEIHLIPTMGGGKGGFFQIVLGAVLIVASIIMPAGAPIFAGAAGALGAVTWSGLALSLGMSMLMGGLLAVLSPVPKMETGSNSSEADPAASQYLGANQNTVKIGTRIPLLYGEHIAYGQYLSFDVDAVDVAV